MRTPPWDRLETFELTSEHVTLLRASYVSGELSGSEYGAAEINPKRPYGNSDVERDIALLLGIELVDGEYLRDADAARCRALHEQTPTGSFEPGVYEQVNQYGKDWRLAQNQGGV